MKSFRAMPYRYTVYVTSDTAEMDAAYAAAGGQDKHDWQAGAVWCSGGNVYLGVFDGELGTLAHEAAHAALDISNRVGYDPTGEQEPFAYLLEYIFVKARKKLGL